jgi:solute carrier family 25 uncoupling protein 8/9
MRSLIYGGLRLGLYEPCKHVCSYAFGSTNFAFKFASGVVAGALATALTNPMEVVKVYCCNIYLLPSMNRLIDLI